jgi:hypothetical protein
VPASPFPRTVYFICPDVGGSSILSSRNNSRRLHVITSMKTRIFNEMSVEKPHKTFGVDCRCNWQNQDDIWTNLHNRMGYQLCKTKAGRAIVSSARNKRIRGLHVSFDISYMGFYHKILFSSHRSYTKEISNVRNNEPL